jgi:hypothetical protein
MIHLRYRLGLGGTLALVGPVLLNCSSSSNSATAADDGGAACYPDNDGINNVVATIDLVVDDSGFYSSDVDAGMKLVISTQNDSMVTLTLTNMGTNPHGFEVECTSVLPAYPNLPAGCSSTACFPTSSTIAPIAAGASTTITFDTPTPDNLLYPFKSSEPGDSTVAGLNGSMGTAWSLM